VQAKWWFKEKEKMNTLNSPSGDVRELFTSKIPIFRLHMWDSDRDWCILIGSFISSSSGQWWMHIVFTTLHSTSSGISQVKIWQRRDYHVSIIIIIILFLGIHFFFTALQSGVSKHQSHSDVHRYISAISSFDVTYTDISPFISWMVKLRWVYFTPLSPLPSLSLFASWTWHPSTAKSSGARQGHPG